MIYESLKSIYLGFKRRNSDSGSRNVVAYMIMIVMMMIYRVFFFTGPPLKKKQVPNHVRVSRLGLPWSSPKSSSVYTGLNTRKPYVGRDGIGNLFDG